MNGQNALVSRAAAHQFSAHTIPRRSRKSRDVRALVLGCGRSILAAMQFRRCVLLLAILLQAGACSPRTPEPVVWAGPVVEALGARNYFQVHFDAGSAILTTAADHEVMQAAIMTTKVRMETMELRGHGDPTGSVTANRRLAARRARTVADKLVRVGVPRSQIEVTNPEAGNRWSDSSVEIIFH